MSDYTNDLKKARAELDELLALGEDIQVRIAKQQRRVAALAQLAEDNEENTDSSVDLKIEGLTETVSAVLKAVFPEGLTTGEIRKALIQFYFPVEGYKNFRASLHTTLKRLIESGLVARPAEAREDETKYFWVRRYSSGRFRGRFVTPKKNRFSGRFDRTTKNE
jgi:hypothetical protein